MTALLKLLPASIADDQVAPSLDVYCTQYFATARPLAADAVHPTVTCPFAGVSELIVGAPGTPYGFVFVDTTADSTPSPAALTAFNFT